MVRNKGIHGFKGKTWFFFEDFLLAMQLQTVRRRGQFLNPV